MRGTKLRLKDFYIFIEYFYINKNLSKKQSEQIQFTNKEMKNRFDILLKFWVVNLLKLRILNRWYNFLDKYKVSAGNIISPTFYEDSNKERNSYNQTTMFYDWNKIKNNFKPWDYFNIDYEVNTYYFFENFFKVLKWKNWIWNDIELYTKNLYDYIQEKNWWKINSTGLIRLSR